MESNATFSHKNRPFLTWQLIIDWAEEHYRSRIFNKDERIPTRPGLLYLVQKGFIRLAGSTYTVPDRKKSKPKPVETDPEEQTFLGFVGPGQPFELAQTSPFTLQAYAYCEETTVLWMYWQDLDNWPHFRREVLDAFRYQHQRKLLWLSVLGQRRSIDRLYGSIALLAEEFGEPCQWGEKLEQRGDRLPWLLTHAQIGTAIGATRVTVTRMMGQLRQQGLIHVLDDNYICMPVKLTSNN
ncbi:MAG: Crp/Fnr family transcriptional regulator [Cyanobacteriota bacterium]|nr:Crp/Fnr family transcriptional regulator [Cyanobacteriota bacterium]